jgi:exodeoxyribonuclease VII small subunit
MSEPSDIAAMSFEKALEELEQIVGRLESGQAPLDESIEIYKRGSALRAHCEAKLNAARLQVEKITKSLDGPPKAEPADFG